MQNRLMELETRISYQDHTISELNEVVTDQQQQIDVLGKLVKQLRSQFNQTQDSGLAHPDEEVPPPHY